MRLSDLNRNKHASYKDYLAETKRELAKQHTEIINEEMKKAELDGMGKLSASKFNRSVQSDLEKIVKREPTIYKKPQTSYP